MASREDWVDQGFALSSTTSTPARQVARGRREAGGAVCVLRGFLQQQFEESGGGYVSAANGSSINVRAAPAASGAQPNLRVCCR
jgi:hypothetical protein